MAFETDRITTKAQPEVQFKAVEENEHPPPKLADDVSTTTAKITKDEDVVTLETDNDVVEVSSDSSDSEIEVIQPVRPQPETKARPVEMGKQRLNLIQYRIGVPQHVFTLLYYAFLFRC